MRTHGTSSKTTINNKTRPAGSFWHFPPSSQAGRLAGAVFYTLIFSLVIPVGRADGTTRRGSDRARIWPYCQPWRRRPARPRCLALVPHPEICSGRLCEQKFGSARRKIRRKEGIAKCRHLKKINLERDFVAGVYLSKSRNSIPPPLYTLFTCIQHAGKGGELNQRGG